VVGSFEELGDAVVELLLFVSAELVTAVSLLECLVTADVEHASEHVSVTFHSDSFHVSFHFEASCGLLNYN